MAVLHDKSGKREFLLQARQVTEYGSPTWVLTRVEFRQHEIVFLSTTVSVTLDDLALLRSGLRDVVDGRLNEFTISNTDEDLVVQVQPALSVGDFFMGLWIGEPYEVMKGFRVAVKGEDLLRFCQELRADEDTLLSTSHLPD